MKVVNVLDRKSIVRKRRIEIIILFGYIILNGILLLFHESWRDEAQTWLLCRDLTIKQLFAQMAYEGHPCLWHLIIFPFAKLGFPYFTQGIISLSITSAAAAILIFKSNFSIFTKTIITFSPILTYYFPVISRSYCLIPLILFLLAQFYPRRLEKPFLYSFLLALLVQTHLIMIFTAFILSLFFLVELINNYRKEKILKVFLRKGMSLFLPLISVILFYLQVSGAVSKSSAFNLPAAMTFNGIIGEVIYVIVHEIKKLTINSLALALFIIFSVLTIAWIVYILCKKTKNSFIHIASLLGSFLFQMSIIAFVYKVSHFQRVLTIPLILIWGIWILLKNSEDSRADNKYKTILGESVICLLCVWFSIYGYTVIIKDVSQPYSNAQETATFIQDCLPNDSVFYCDSQPHTSPILPYDNSLTFYYTGNGEKFSYVTWDSKYNQATTFDSFMKICNQPCNNGKNVYLIRVSRNHSSTITDIDEHLDSIQTIYTTDRYSLVGDEDYTIYLIKKAK